jgi:hypothetical protein
MTNLKLEAINERRRRNSVGVTAYRTTEDGEITEVTAFPDYDAQGLLDGVKNFIKSYQTLWKKKVSLAKEQIEASRKDYNRSRDCLVSLGVDVSGLPKRLRILEDNA